MIVEGIAGLTFFSFGNKYLGGSIKCEEIISNSLI